MSALIDLTGKSFNRLTVLRKSSVASKAGAMWVCVCECGKLTRTTGQKLKHGHTMSCGCLKKETIRKVNLTHGQSNKTRTYRTWKEMRQRCLNPNSDKWKWYGGKGVTICDRWSDFSSFLLDMGERPIGLTIDRINNDGPYSPDNCQWLSQKEQTRKQSKNKLTMESASQMRRDRESGCSAAHLARQYSVSMSTVYKCLKMQTWC